MIENEKKLHILFEGYKSKFKKYSQWNDLKLILNDIGSNIENLPFENEKIIDTLRSVFIK